MRTGWRYVAAGSVIVGAAVIVAEPSSSAPGDTTLASVDTTGAAGGRSSIDASLSADGRFVAFSSAADDLVADDTNTIPDVFVRDLASGVTERVSVDSAGVQAVAPAGVVLCCKEAPGSSDPAISADGRYVAFASTAGNLVAGDSNGRGDVFVHDRLTGATTRVSVSSSGAEASMSSFAPTISADGSVVAFHSSSPDLVVGDTNSRSDVFVHDRRTGATTIASIGATGGPANAASLFPAISGDGLTLVYESFATNLVPQSDRNRSLDIFAVDLTTGVTTRESVSAGGVEANGMNHEPAISSDGRLVVFASKATNLVPGDVNGVQDIFVRDRSTGSVRNASLDGAGALSNGDSHWPVVTDAGLVAFFSGASNLVPGDTNGTDDVFVHDLQSGTTTRESVSSVGAQATAASQFPAISANGGVVAFHSSAGNLVDGDANGADDVFVRELLPRPPATSTTDTSATSSTDTSATSSTDTSSTSSTDTTSASSSSTTTSSTTATTSSTTSTTVATGGKPFRPPVK